MGENGLEKVNYMKVTLTSDHRVVDGAVAAEWGTCFKGLIKNPETLIL